MMQTLHADSPRYTPLAVFLAVAMIPVLGAMALDARQFQGVDVWAKPLKFLVALVVYLMTLAWMARFADPGVTARPWWRWHERAVVVAVLAEMVWIGGAAAHGVGSHFNVGTPAMALVYSWMGMAAILLTSATTTLAWAVHRSAPGRLSPALKSGLVWGLALTLPLTLVTAGTLSGNGSHWVGGTPSDAGGLAGMGWSRDGGDLRVAHFLATHALHAIPLAAWGLSRWVGASAVGAVRAFALLYTAFVFFTFAQALRGQPFLPGLG
jgi:hypothetical protein